MSLPVTQNPDSFVFYPNILIVSSFTQNPDFSALSSDNQNAELTIFDYFQDLFENEEEAKRRRELLARRPSYRCAFDFVLFFMIFFVD